MWFGQTNEQQKVTSNVVISGNAISLNSSYELDTSSAVQYLQLKKYKNFGFFNRTIAAADSEFGWTWDNRSQISSANENSSTANAAHFVAVSTTSDWYDATFTAARRYKTYTFSTEALLKPKSVIARFSNNASTNYTGCGIQITDSANDGTYARYQIGFAAAAEKIISYVSGTPQETACTAQNLTDGIWLKMTFFNGTITFDYNLSTSTTPPTTGWVRDRSTNFTLDIAKSYQIGFIQLVNASSSGLVSKWHYYDDTGLAGETLDAANPTWCAQGFDTGNTSIQLLADYDMGSTAPTLNQAYLRNLLQDYTNKKSGDAATWTFSVVQSSTVGAAAGSFQSMATQTVAGSGRYANIWAKANSDGTQAGSLYLPITLPITAN